MHIKNIFFSAMAFSSLILVNTGLAMDETVPVWEPYVDIAQQTLSTLDGSVIVLSTSSRSCAYGLENPTTHEVTPVENAQVLQLITNAVRTPIVKYQNTQLNRSSHCPLTNTGGSNSHSSPADSPSSHSMGTTDRLRPAPANDPHDKGAEKTFPRFDTIRVLKPATYELKITGAAATVGVVTAQLAEKKFGTTKKKAFFAGILTTSAMSTGCQYAQHVHRQNEFDISIIATQLAIDNGVYIASNLLINYMSPAKTKQVKDENQELLKSATNSKNTQTGQSDKAPEKILVPKSALTVPPLLSASKK